MCSAHDYLGLAPPLPYSYPDAQQGWGPVLEAGCISKQQAFEKGLKSLSVSSQLTASLTEAEGDVEDFIPSEGRSGHSLRAHGGRADIFICGSLKSCSSQYVFNGNNKNVTTQQCQLS